MHLHEHQTPCSHPAIGSTESLTHLVGAASVKLMYAPQPTPEVIRALADKTIRAVACGHNHTLALDTACAAYTWGAHPVGSRGMPDRATGAAFCMHARMVSLRSADVQVPAA